MSARWCSPKKPCCPCPWPPQQPPARPAPSLVTRPTTGSASRPGAPARTGCLSPSPCSSPRAAWERKKPPGTQRCRAASPPGAPGDASRETRSLGRPRGRKRAVQGSNCWLLDRLLDGQLAVAHRAEALRAPGDGAVVGDHDHRQAVVLPELLKQGDDLVAGVLVEVAGRLVGEQHLGLLDQRAGDRDALLLAAGQLGREVPGPVGEPDRGERLGRARLARRVADPERYQRRLDVLLRRQRRYQVERLEDEPD